MAWILWCLWHRDADKPLARPRRKQANIYVRMAWISFLITARVSMLLKSRATLTYLRVSFFFLVGLRTYQHPRIGPLQVPPIPLHRPIMQRVLLSTWFFFDYKEEVTSTWNVCNKLPTMKCKIPKDCNLHPVNIRQNSPMQLTSC